MFSFISEYAEAIIIALCGIGVGFYISRRGIKSSPALEYFFLAVLVTIAIIAAAKLLWTG